MDANTAIAGFLDKKQFEIARREQFFALRNAGNSRPQIKEKLGISSRTISRWAKELGIIRPKQEWPAEIVKKCAEMWLRGDTASQIAGELNRSASSIIGRMHRLGIKHPERPKDTSGIPVKKRPRRRKVPAGRRDNNGNVFLFRSPKPTPPTIEEAIAADLSIPWDQRQTVFTVDETECRWPVGDPAKPDFFFCGAPKHDGHPYCRAHCERAYEQGRDDLDRLVMVA